MKLHFPVIDPVATGCNILALRKQKGFSVKDLQEWFRFDSPRAVYKWQKGETLPSVDNLFALSVLFEVPIEDILVEQKQYCRMKDQKQPLEHPAAAFDMRCQTAKWILE
ncbi:MAG: helix-turn-helix transcriptional regulator [Clostridia bacterium]|nr:helix-turn-helix transcriptional regulator [Clostridia bacterium]